MSPPVKTRRIEPPSLYDNEAKVPILPDDLMLMIFAELTTQERAILNTSCKRFRELDFEFAKKKLWSIHILWSAIEHRVDAKAPKVHLKILGSIFHPTESTRHNIRLLRKSKTDVLKIRYNNTDHNQRAHFQMISDLLETVTYQYLLVQFDSQLDCSDTFLPKLILNRNLEKSSVFLSWFSDFAPHNVARTREFLLKLPKMGKLKLNWVVHRAFPRAVKESSQCLIDDPTLLHITESVNFAELGEGICTAQGIISAFEVICQSSDNKFVEFSAPRAIIQELFTMDNLGFMKNVANRSIYDTRRKSMISVESDDDYSLVYMGKMDKEENVIRENVYWQL